MSKTGIGRFSSRAWALRIPKPTYLMSRLAGREQPDAETYAALAHLAKVYELGEIVSCGRAKKSNSMNFLVSTRPPRVSRREDPAGERSGGETAVERRDVGQRLRRYVFRRHNLSKETVAHEYEVLSHLEREGFPAPRMLADPQQRAWASIEGSLYSVYAFIEGYRPWDFWWTRRQERAIRRQAGATLASLHRALAGLEPESFKWDAYRASSNGSSSSAGRGSSAMPGVRSALPASPGTRWRDGDLYRCALNEIRSRVSRAEAASSVDQFAKSRIADLERLIAYDSQVEGHPGLNRVVIHGDYAPWNILMQADGSLCVLDFNAARLDLRIYDLMLATMWFAWRGDHLDVETAMDLQTGYCSIAALEPAEIELGAKVFCWLMGRSIAERLRVHYLEQRFLIADPATLERQYQMCAWAERQRPAKHPDAASGKASDDELTRGLRTARGL